MLRPFPSSMRAAANTPAEPVGACVVRFPTGDSLPRYQGGSASASNLSRPARRSLVLRPAWSLSRPWRPVTSKCFRRCRCLHHPLRLLPAGATVAGRDSHPLKNGALHGAPDKAIICNLCRGLKSAPLLEMRDLAAQVYITPHSMPEKRRNCPVSVGNEARFRSDFTDPVGWECRPRRRRAAAAVPIRTPPGPAASGRIGEIWAVVPRNSAI